MKKSTLHKRLKTSALAVALAALPLGALAAGLGKITVLSSLGQPLRAEIEIGASPEEIPSLSARVAPADAFTKAGIEYSSALSGIRFSVEKRPDGQPYLSMRSSQPVNDPFVDMLLELNWASGRLVREYTFLLDPPESIRKPVAQSTPVALPTTRPQEPAKTAPVAAPETTPTPATAPTAPAETPKAAEKPAEQPAEEPAKEKPADMHVVQTPDGKKRLVKTEQPAEKAETHTVKHGETLGKIASGNRPEGVNLDQMLVALFRGNSEAFEGGNMNRLKAGKILTLPDRETVAAIDAKEARQFVVTQSTDFNAYRKKLAAATAAAPTPKEEAPSQQSAAGKITPKVEEKQPAVSKDKLEISRADAAAAKSAAARAATLEEERIAKEKALKEANARIAELDKNLNDLKKLAELKNQSLADLQKQAQATKAAIPPPLPPSPEAAKKPETKPATPTPAPAPIAATPAPTPAPAAVQPAAPGVAPKPAEPAAPATPAPSAAKPAETAQPPAEQATTPSTPASPAAAAKPAAKKPAAPPPPPPPSFLEENSEIVFGGAGVLALLLGYLGFSFWRKKRKASQDSDTNGPSTLTEPSISSVFGSTGGHVVDTAASTANAMQGEFSVAEVGGNSSVEGVDPVKEADVYMAYGRNAQAEEILLDALKTEPQRQAIHLKLLEIYAARKSTKQFESIAADLKGLTGGNGADWERAQQLGLEIDPDNPLYASGGAKEEAPYDPAATMVMSPQELGELAKNLPPESAGEAGQMQATMVQPAVQFPAAKPEEAFSDSIDLELDLGAPAAEAGAEADKPGSAAAAAEGGVDFDVSQTASGTAQEAAAAPADAGAASVDFDFDLGTGPAGAAEKGSSETGMAAAQPAGGDANLIDFDIAAQSTAPAKAASAAGAAEPSLDIALEFPSSQQAAPAPTPTSTVDLGAINLDLDSNVPTAAGTAGGDEDGPPEVATKLELAQAYEEMGDKDGARELLREVLKEGSAKQQATARAKLDKLG